MKLKTPKPYRQGQLDGFCGLYSLVNAMRILGLLHSNKHGQKLMMQLCEVLETDRTLKERLDEGTDSSEITRLFKEVIEPHYRVKRFKPFHRTTSKTTMAEYVVKLDAFLRSKNGVVFVGLAGYHDHWSLISKVTAKSFIFYDSDGLRQLAFRHCQLKAKDHIQRKKKRIHILNPYNTHFLWVE